MVVLPSLCCYGIGAVFAFYFVLPLIFGYLINYSGDVAQVALSADISGVAVDKIKSRQNFSINFIYPCINIIIHTLQEAKMKASKQEKELID